MIPPNLVNLRLPSQRVMTCHSLPRISRFYDFGEGLRSRFVTLNTRVFGANCGADSLARRPSSAGDDPSAEFFALSRHPFHNRMDATLPLFTKVGDALASGGPKTPIETTADLDMQFAISWFQCFALSAGIPSINSSRHYKSHGPALY